jgi:hypothetical protein
MKMFRKILAWILISSITFIIVASASTNLAIQSRNLYLSLIEPASEYLARIEPRTIMSGDPLTVIYHFNRQRVCETDVTTVIRNKSTEEVFWRNRFPAGTTAIGRITTTNVLRIPNLKPGIYVLETLVFSKCFDGNYTKSYPSAEFEIID